MPRKPAMGRQKIEIKEIVSDAKKLSTFSKRRAGLFKKASDLSILCGVEVGIIIFSPSGKSFSFGYPSVESVINRFLRGNFPSIAVPAPLPVDALREFRVRDLIEQHLETTNMLEDEKKEAEELEKLENAKENKFLWETPMQELGLDELMQLKDVMNELKKKICCRADELSINSSAST